METSQNPLLDLADRIRESRIRDSRTKLESIDDQKIDLESKDKGAADYTRLQRRVSNIEDQATSEVTSIALDALTKSFDSVNPESMTMAQARALKKEVEQVRGIIQQNPDEQNREELDEELKEILKKMERHMGAMAFASRSVKGRAKETFGRMFDVKSIIAQATNSNPVVMTGMDFVGGLVTDMREQKKKAKLLDLEAQKRIEEIKIRIEESRSADLEGQPEKQSRSKREVEDEVSSDFATENLAEEIERITGKQTSDLNEHIDALSGVFEKGFTEGLNEALSESQAQLQEVALELGISVEELNKKIQDAFSNEEAIREAMSVQAGVSEPMNTLLGDHKIDVSGEAPGGLSGTSQNVVETVEASHDLLSETIEQGNDRIVSSIEELQVIMRKVHEEEMKRNRREGIAAKRSIEDRLEGGSVRGSMGINGARVGKGRGALGAAAGLAGAAGASGLGNTLLNVADAGANVLMLREMMKERNKNKPPAPKGKFGRVMSAGGRLLGGVAGAVGLGSLASGIGGGFMGGAEEAAPTITPTPDVDSKEKPDAKPKATPKGSKTKTAFKIAKTLGRGALLGGRLLGMATPLGMAITAGTLAYSGYNAYRGYKEKQSNFRDSLNANMRGVQDVDYSEDGGLGSVSAKFESDKRGVSTISDGTGDHGGQSYGKHQMIAKTIKDFMKHEGKPWSKELGNLKPGTLAFNQKYTEIARKDAKRFGDAQFNYIKRTHYEAGLKELALEHGVVLPKHDRAIQEMIFSTMVQYGPGLGSRVVANALDGKNISRMTSREIVNAVQDQKSANVHRHFRSSSRKFQEGILGRIEKERMILTSGALDGGSEMAQSVEPITTALNDVSEPPQSASSRPSTRRDRRQQRIERAQETTLSPVNIAGPNIESESKVAEMAQASKDVQMAQTQPMMSPVTPNINVAAAPAPNVNVAPAPVVMPDTRDRTADRILSRDTLMAGT